MFKKYLSLFLLFTLVISSFILFYPHNTLGANDHVVISQIQTGEVTNDEFIELFNPTESDVDLSGYKLSRRNSGGVTEVNLVANMSGIIKSNGYFLVGPVTGYTGSVPLDLNYSAISNVITSNYSVRIYSSLDILIDKVGFGTSPDSETSPFTTNPAIGQSIQRINNQDTDNNSLDFELLQVSNPRNSTTVVATSTPTVTSSPTATPTATATATATPTSTPTASPTRTPVVTGSPTSTPSPTPIVTITPTATTTSSPVATGASNNHLLFDFRSVMQKIYLKFKIVQLKFFAFHF